MEELWAFVEQSLSCGSSLSAEALDGALDEVLGGMLFLEACLVGLAGSRAGSAPPGACLVGPV